MNLAHFQQRKLFQSILRVVATSLRVCVHKMYEREHRRWQAQVGRSGGMLPREKNEKAVQLGAFWHIFMQFISCSESIIFQQAKAYNFEMNW